MSVKITSLELENIKRIKAVKLEPSENGLTIIGGNNCQGKTSVLDAIAWALGGERYRPATPHRTGAYTEPFLHIVLSNGVIVERKGKNSSLKVVDPTGNRSGQQLLNTFLTTFALDLPKFLQASPTEKANILLQITGLGDKLADVERREAEAYNQRTAIGRIADQKQKYADSLQKWHDVPETPVSAAEQIKQQQEILLQNAENQRKRQHKKELELQYEQICQKYLQILEQKQQIEKDLQIARTAVQDLQDASTADLERTIAEIDVINAKVRDNLNREKAESEAEQYRTEYQQLSQKVDAIRQEKKDLLQNADLPLAGLAVENGVLLYKGQPWDCMSGAEQLQVATAIIRKQNPNCGFVLLDKLEQMDRATLQTFGQWLEQEGLQAIATRVSTGEECSIIIEDGYSVNNQEQQPKPPTMQKTWTKGAF